MIRMTSLTLSRVTSCYRYNFRISSLCKVGCYFLLVIAAIEFIFLNFLTAYLYKAVSAELAQIQSYQSNSFLVKLHNNDKIRSIVSNARDGGFLSLLQNSVERLYVVKEPVENGLLFQNENDDTNDKGKQKKDIERKEIFSFGLDVSHSGEASFIYQRILARSKFPYKKCIVDIGANDGFISSNSFNFIQFGWNAVLVEPQLSQIQLAKNNLKRYIAINREPRHKVDFVQAAIGSTDGAVQLLHNIEPQESRVLAADDPRMMNDNVVQVPSLTVKTLALRYKIPRNLAILSIDAEGMGFEILQQWFALKFTPAYIIFETLHIRNSRQSMAKAFDENEYVFIGKRGWNDIYEHRPSWLRNLN